MAIKISGNTIIDDNRNILFSNTVQFDTDDSITYNKTTNQLDVNIGSSSKLSVNSTYVNVPALAIAGAPFVPDTSQVFEYTSSGTWAKPDDCSVVLVEAWGAGGGGGSGAYGNVVTDNVSGGGGGGGGGYFQKIYDANNLTSNVTITIGAGGTGSSAKTSDSSGGDGGNGGDTSFGNYFKVDGGSGGGGGRVGTFANVGNGGDSIDWMTNVISAVGKGANSLVRDAWLGGASGGFSVEDSSGYTGGKSAFGGCGGGGGGSAENGGSTINSPGSGGSSNTSISDGGNGGVANSTLTAANGANGGIASGGGGGGGFANTAKPFAEATYVGGYTLANDGTTSNITIDLTSLTDGSNDPVPLAPQEGDIVIIAFTSSETNDISYRISDGTSNYTQIADLYVSDNYDTNLQVGYKIMGASPDTSATITGGTNNNIRAGTIAVQVWRPKDFSYEPVTLGNTVFTDTNLNTVIPLAVDENNVPTDYDNTIIIYIGASAHNQGTQTYTNTSLSNFITVGGNGGAGDSTIGMGSFLETSGGTSYDINAFGFTDTDSTEYSSACVAFAIQPTIHPSFASGAGGAGGDGFVRIYTW